MSSETPSVDQYQPLPVTIKRHSQLKAPLDDLATSQINDDVAKNNQLPVAAAASETPTPEVTASEKPEVAVAAAVVETEVPLSTGNTASDEQLEHVTPAVQLEVTTEIAKEDETETAQPEEVLREPTAEETSEAMKEIEKLRSLTRSLKAAVDESRKADGLDAVDVTSHGHGEAEGAGKKAHEHDHNHHDGDEEHDHDDVDLHGDLASRARQSRSEKKARKALCKLGLKPVSGVSQVTIRRKKNVMFIISRPDVFVNSSSETYIVFGEARIEDTEERAKQEAARHLMESGAASRTKTAAAAAEANAVEHEEEDEDEKLDESGLTDKDIDLVMSQAGVSRSRAVRALLQNDNDIVNAIMALTT